MGSQAEVEIVIDACPPQATAAPASPPTLDFPAPPAGKAGERYRLSLAVDGGVEPYAWSLASGSLPQGLTLNPSTGMLSGTPVKAGIYPFTVMVTDNEDASATQAVKLTISPKPTRHADPRAGGEEEGAGRQGHDTGCGQDAAYQGGPEGDDHRERDVDHTQCLKVVDQNPGRGHHVGRQEAGGDHRGQPAMPAVWHADPDSPPPRRRVRRGAR